MREVRKLLLVVLVLIISLGAVTCDTDNGSGSNTDCKTDAECTNDNVCDGIETCNLTTSQCESGPALDCIDGDTCTSDTCDPVSGCSYPVIDADSDGHGPGELCGGDCNDNAADIYTGAPEICDSLDNDCDTSVDEGLTITRWFADCDGDGYADEAAEYLDFCEMPDFSSSESCPYWTLTDPATYSDCLEGDAGSYPGGTEICDDLDNDCDFTVDEGC